MKSIILSLFQGDVFFPPQKGTCNKPVMERVDVSMYLMCKPFEKSGEQQNLMETIWVCQNFRQPLVTPKKLISLWTLLKENTRGIY